MSIVYLTIVLVAGAVTGETQAKAYDSPVVAWNEQLLQVAADEDGFLTLKGVRAAAMMHLAMHDALSRFDGRYEPYASGGEPPNGASIQALVQAAYAVAVDQYPQKQQQFADLRQRWLPDEATASAVRLGNAVASRILRQRADDGWDNAPEYRWHPMAPGVYAEFHEHSMTPEGFVFGAGWGSARPFALSSADQFRSPPPPDINSDAYTAAFNEVKRVGRFESAARTADQTHLALWWKDFAESSHNRLARDLVRKEQLDTVRTARLFALLNVSIFDAYINVFNNKFHFNHWRPYTAIRWAANDGNPDTAEDVSWTNTHRHTYAFPSYPSAHGTACAAAMTVMADTFGDDYAFSMRTTEVDIAGPFSGKMRMEPVHREFDNFSAAARECALSRLYLGIHFRYDSEVGTQLGDEIGRFVTGHILRPRIAD